MTSVARELHAQFDMDRFMDIVSRELGVAYARLPVRQDSVILAGGGGRVTERAARHPLAGQPRRRCGRGRRCAAVPLAQAAMAEGEGAGRARPTATSSA